MARRENDEIFKVYAQFKVEAYFSALPLERLERFEGVSPFGCDLCQREIGASSAHSFGDRMVFLPYCVAVSLFPFRDHSEVRLTPPSLNFS